MLWHDAIQQLPRGETLQASCQRDTMLITGLGWVYFILMVPEPFLCLWTRSSSRPALIPPLVFTAAQIPFQLLPKTPDPISGWLRPRQTPLSSSGLPINISTQLCQLLLPDIPLGMPCVGWQKLFCGFPWVGPIFLLPRDTPCHKWEGFFHWGCS